MKNWMIILMLGMSPAAFSLNAPTTIPTDNSSSTEIISLEKVPIIEVTLNGKSAYFVLDSGSDVSLLHSLAARTYGFSFQKRASKALIGASGGSQPLHKVSVIDLQIERQSLQTLYYATDLSSVVESLKTSTGTKISGIIGMDLMRKYGFQVDYSSRQLVLHSSN